MPNVELRTKRAAASRGTIEASRKPPRETFSQLPVTVTVVTIGMPQRDLLQTLGPRGR